jgi:hypothetical protein
VLEVPLFLILNLKVAQEALPLTLSPIVAQEAPPTVLTQKAQEAPPSRGPRMVQEVLPAEKVVGKRPLW